ncbi:MAG: ABC transporter ATP-binding protein [Clostridia bacterium]|nr:ABC transporter ATP-binding protein [Clostridia bacterium]
MITVENLTKTFDAVVAVNNISTFVEEGSIFGLIGSNGSGKSTLLRMLCGIFRPDSGTILYGGSPVYDNYDLKQSIVYLSDEQYFPWGATLNDMRELYKSVYNGFDDERYTKMTEIFGLDKTRKIATFSKGMQRQSALLLGMSLRPKYLLCDETFDGIDPVMRKVVRSLIAEDSEESGLTAIISSHNLLELENICDHIALFHHGGILLDMGLDDAKISTHKLQVVFSGLYEPDFSGIDVINHRVAGKLHTITCRGDADEIENKLKSFGVQYYENVPLTLEEIFITEMEEIGYDSSAILEK